jgi:2-polyprenyl-6-methoxyphenol hydroxylase-like FAD-dependent oxidoreductase
MEQIFPSMKNPKTQLIIIGAGPTGLSMAAELIRHKVDFIIIEKNERTTHLSKAIAIQARTLEIFQELGIADEAIKRGQLTTGMNLFSKGRQRASVDLAGLGKGLSEFSFALSLEQSKTEQLLAEYLLKNEKQVQWGSELRHFEQDEKGVAVYYKDKNGADQIAEADYLVGCDGAGSLVRHQLGFTFEGSTESKLFYVADVILKSPVINQNRLYMYMIPKGFVLFFPMEGTGHYRIIGVLPEHGDDNHEYSFQEVEPVIKKGIVTPVDFEQLQWFSTYKVHSRKANSFMDRRCFIAGDAAHIHTPAGGQGMNTGIQDAYNLAWKIAYRLKGEVNDKVLQSYNTERTQNAKRLLNTTDRMFDIMAGVNGFWNFIRLGFFPVFLVVLSTSNFVRRRIFPLLSQIGIAYHDSYLTTKSTVGKVKAGDRMHYFVFADGRTIFSYLSEPVFKLLYFGHQPVENPSNSFGITMNFQSFTEIPASIFGSNTDFYVLVRPDNHISYIGKDITECHKLFNKFKPS